MKPLTILLTFIALTFSENTKHVFWYKCIEKNYSLSDSAEGKGPNIQGNIIKHEGIALTSELRGSAAQLTPSITLGNGLDNLQARSCVFWYKDLCNLKLSPDAKLKSAKFRGEYCDGWAGIAFCNTGTIKTRIGIADMQGHFSASGTTPLSCPENALWLDFMNPISGNMGYSQSGEPFKAEEIKIISIPQGNDGKNTALLEGKFFEMDILKQVDFILNNDGQYVIGAAVNAGDGYTGKIKLYAYEDCRIPAGTSAPWTQDGNTTHLLLEIENGTLIPKDQNTSEKVSIVSNKLSLAVQPNPFNASTQIVYNCGNGITGTLKLFSINGTLSFSKDIQGAGSHTLKAANLSNGVYICRLSTKEGQLTERLLLRK